MAAWSKATVTMLVSLSAAALATGCAARGDKPTPAEPEAPRKSANERMDEARRGMADAAISPFKDVGLVRPVVPLMLQDLTYPYDVSSLAGSCVNVSYELGRLDATLGAETYQRGPKASMSERGLDQAQSEATKALRGAATDFIPFRSVVRRASGAEKAARQADRARQIGELRRSFLRGYGASLGCSNLTLPAPPPPEKPNR
ncbi:MAG: hypothetical protein ACOYJ6_01900 [Caulobacterales bacterium]